MVVYRASKRCTRGSIRRFGRVWIQDLRAHNALSSFGLVVLGFVLQEIYGLDVGSM